MNSWSNIKRILFCVALAYMYTYNKVNFSLLSSIVSMTSVGLGDVAECCSGPFSHHIQYIFAQDLYPATRNPDTFRNRSWNTINSSTHVRYLTAIQHGSQNKCKRVWNMANSAAIAKLHNNCIWTMKRYVLIPKMDDF